MPVSLWRRSSKVVYRHAIRAKHTRQLMDPCFPDGKFYTGIVAATDLYLQFGTCQKPFYQTTEVRWPDLKLIVVNLGQSYSSGNLRVLLLSILIQHLLNKLRKSISWLSFLRLFKNLFFALDVMLIINCLLTPIFRVAILEWTLIQWNTSSRHGVKHWRNIQRFRHCKMDWSNKEKAAKKRYD